MSIKVISGNIWNTKCQVLVNTVNCVGIMGAGIALEAKLRYPEMFKTYKEYCDNKSLEIGKLHLYTLSTPYWILNFPTKKHWKYPSKESYLINGLKKFRETYKEKNIKSIAFPILGGANGGLDEKIVIDLMYKYLSDLDDIEIEIYQYNSKETDNFFLSFKELILNTDLYHLSKDIKIQKRFLDIIYNELSVNNEIYQINQLAKIKGIGENTLEKIFSYMKEKGTNQLGLV